MHRPVLVAALAAAALVPSAAAIAAGPLEVVTRVLVERRVAAPDGTTRIVAAPRGRAAPGDRLVVELAYRNTGRQPIADLVVGDRVPAELSYRGPVPGGAAPEVSLDGMHYALLAELAATPAGGAPRPAVADDVVAIRWRLAAPIAAGGAGTLSFRAVLR